MSSSDQPATDDEIKAAAEAVEAAKTKVNTSTAEYLSSLKLFFSAIENFSIELNKSVNPDIIKRKNNDLITNYKTVATNLFTPIDENSKEDQLIDSHNAMTTWHDELKYIYGSEQNMPINKAFSTPRNGSRQIQQSGIQKTDSDLILNGSISPNARSDVLSDKKKSSQSRQKGRPPITPGYSSPPTEFQATNPNMPPPIPSSPSSPSSRIGGSRRRPRRASRRRHKSKRRSRRARKGRKSRRK
jgi:hypothetical protein